MATLNPYGKLDEAEQERLVARMKTRRRITIIAISSFVLVAIVVATVVGVTQTQKNNNNTSDNANNSISSSIKSVCATTLYPDSCYASLSPLVKSGKINPQDIYKLSVQVAIDELSTVSKNFVKNLNVTDQAVLNAIDSCNELLSLSFDHLNRSLSIKDLKILDAFRDLRTWLSSAGTYQQTCIDDLKAASNGSSVVSSFLDDAFTNSTEYTSNSLAIISSFEESMEAMGAIKRRRLMGVEGMPEWVSGKDRRLLQTASAKIKADVVVAKDGSGKYKRIKDALKEVPEKSGKRFVIYVKRGVYVENVRVEKSMWNVMIVGDGKDVSVVSGSLNVVDGTPTFQSATFAVFGQGFIARDMGFRNTAGPAKHQAVALMSTADQSVFYRCTMDAFQDTLYVHSNRQFYRECNIYGTVDFIFGNSAVVIQNCNILPKKPMLGQQNTITAQGKMDPNQNTGISIQNCTIWPAANLSGVSTFLGRPWKNYSTTVFFNSVMGSLIDPKGWLPWVGDSAPNTIFYAEFQNLGPGAVTKQRVNWKGLKLNLSAAQVKKFTVGPFVQGDKWIPATGVTYKSGL